ncbi:hypothetical protein HELRODRAFT_67343, partial [Helobdella robusta]|uniref:RRM domain-containing protein n=1 Tax=Helobdella robusta TaxID=6412 RepID=T1FYZ9_HELRO
FGTILPKEVSFFNLNNNVDVPFLTDICKFAGSIEDVKIYLHPTTKKHLGIGSVLYTSTKAAKVCVDKLNNSTSMGNIMNVIIDIRGLLFAYSYLTFLIPMELKRFRLY